MTMKVLSKKRRPVITAELLLKIFQKADDFFFCLNYPSLTRHMSARAARQYLDYKWNGLPKPLTRLKNDGMISVKKINDQVLIKITKKGKIAALQILISKIHKNLPIGEQLVVAFDIPEVARNARYMFRYSLRKMGFKQLQKSIWVTQHDVINEMQRFIGLLKIESWVFIFKTISI
jgi:uncharacterized protein YuzE